MAEQEFQLALEPTQSLPACVLLPVFFLIRNKDLFTDGREILAIMV